MQMSDLLEKSGLRCSFNDPRIWISKDSENGVSSVRER